MPQVIGALSLDRSIKTLPSSDSYVYGYAGPGLALRLVDRATRGGEIRVDLPALPGGVESYVTLRLVGTPTNLVATVNGDTITFGSVSIQIRETGDCHLSAAYTLTVTSKPSSGSVSWAVTASNAAFALQPDGSVAISTPSGDVYYTQPAPTATDKNGAAVGVTASYTGGTLTYTIQNVAPSRYPLLVDPTTVATTPSAAATGYGYQNHLIYAANSGTWWAFVWDSTSTLTAYHASSTDLTSATWTAASTKMTTGGTNNQSGQFFSIAYKNIGAVDVVHIGSDYTSPIGNYAARGHVSTTAFTVDDADAQVGSTGTFYANTSSHAAFLSTNVPVHASGEMDTSGTLQGNLVTSVATNADTGTAWINGWGAVTHIVGAVNFIGGYFLADLGAGTALVVSDSGSGTGTGNNFFYSKYNGTSWSASATVLGTNLTTAIGPTDYGFVAVSTTDIHLVYRTGTNAWSHKRYNGTAWIAGQTITAQTFKAGSNVFLATDGTNVWLFTIDSDAANTIRYCKWNGTSWGSWTALVTTTATRSSLSGCSQVGGGSVGLLWVEGTASPYNIVATSLNTSGNATGTGTIAGIGALSGTATVLVPSGTASVASVGALSGVGAVLVPASAATIAGIGALSGAGAILVHAPAGSVAGVGALNGAATILIPSGAATLADIGALSGAATVLVPSGAATVAEVGALNALGTVLVPAGAATLANINTLAGAGVVLVPSPFATIGDIGALSGAATILVPSGAATIADIGALSGTATILVPAPAGTLTNLNTLAGSAVVLVPAASNTVAVIDALSGSGTVFSPGGPVTGTVAGVGGLSGSGVVLVPGAGTVAGVGALSGSPVVLVSGAASIAGVGALAGSSVVLVPAGGGTVAGVGALGGSGSASSAITGVIGTTGALGGSGVVLVPSGTAVISGINTITGQVGPVIVAVYTVYRAMLRANLYRAGYRTNQYSAATRLNLYRAKGAVGMSAVQDNGQENSVLRAGETNQPFSMDYKTTPLGTGEHVTGCSIVVKQVTSYGSVDVTAQLCPVQPVPADIVNDVVTAYLNGAAATVGAKYKVLYYAATNATKPTVRVEDISYVYCDE